MIDKLTKITSVAVIVAMIMGLTLISGCAERGTDIDMDSEVEQEDMSTTDDTQGNDTLNTTVGDVGSDTVGSVSKDELDSLKEDLEEMEFESPGGLLEE